MVLRDIVERFEKRAAHAVMARATLANILAPEKMDAIFEANAQRQRNEELLFSTVADIMAAVACRIRPSVHAAYQDRVDELGVTAKAVYDKLQGVETAVSRAVVRDTALQMAAIIEKTKGTLPELLPGYRIKIADGNHLRRTERRIAELREINGAPLPGHAVAVLDPRLGLVIDVIPCEDGHAQERTLLPELLETVEPRDLWITDRNFATMNFLMTIAARRAYFVVRQHGACLRYELIGKQKQVGHTDTGIVYEQAMCIWDEEGNEKKIRRITVHLYEATRDGDVEIHILSNLPKRVTAFRIAELYGKRWKIETAFQEVAENLHGEVVTLGYPKAALFGFCMALLAYNVLSVIKAAMRTAHGVEKIEEELSIYYVADEVAQTYRGMEIAVPMSYWEKRYSGLTAAQMARELVRIAKGVNLRRYRKHKRGPKKPANHFNKKNRPHVSTARILAARGST